MPAISGSPARGHVLQLPKATSAEARADFLSETSLPSILVLDFNASLHALRAATGFLLWAVWSRLTGLQPLWGSQPFFKCCCYFL